MADRLSSRERMLATINHQEPEHIPLWFNWYYGDTQLIQWDGIDVVDRAERVIAFGLDDTMRLDVPYSVHPEASSKAWVEHPAESRYPLICKEWYTPKGTMRQVVRRTDDWNAPEFKYHYENDLPLAASFVQPRTVEWPVKDVEDIEKMEYFYQPPTKDQLAEFRETVRRAKELDRRCGVLLEGGWIPLADFVLDLLGFSTVVTAQADRPEFLDALLASVARREWANVEILLDAGVDIITHQGWYEIPDFWGVQGFRRFLEPHIKREIDLVHSAGAKFSYIMTSGIGPRLDDLLDLGIDILWGVDPVQDITANLPGFKRKAGDRICLLGGVNAQVTLVLGSEDDIRREVRYARDTLAPGGGFIMAPIDNIYPFTPRQNLEILIDEWKRVRDYPLR